MIVLFDIDQTIIDHNKWSEKRNQHIARLLEVNEDEFDTLRRAFRSTLGQPEDYTIQGLAEFLTDKLQKDAGFIITEYFKPELMQEAVFPDVFPTLEFLNQNNIRIGLYSAGRYESQFGKARASGVLEYIDQDLMFLNLYKDTDEYISKLP